MMTTLYDNQLDHILNQIVADYRVEVESSDWATHSAHEKTQMLLRQQQLLVAVTSKPSADLTGAYRAFCKLMTRLYDFLVDRLFASVAGEAPTGRLYEATDFLVIVLTAPATNVIEVIGQVVLPFVSEFYGQPLADSQQNHQIAIEVLQQLFADPDDKHMHKGIIQCLDAMRIQQLQPLALRRTGESLRVTAQQPGQESETNGSSQTPPPSPDEILLGRNARRRTAPLPGYFDSDDCQS